MMTNNYTEAQLKHLEFIQAIISRVNTNSFQVKAWSIGIVTALLAAQSALDNPPSLLIALVPIVLFFFLDAYYLWQETLFRKLYDDVAKGDILNFSMDNSEFKKSTSFWKIADSKTIFWLYVLQMSVVVLKACIIRALL